MTQLNFEIVFLFVVFAVPGLISRHVYGLLMPSRPLEWSDSVMQALFYSVLNLGLLSWVVIWLVEDSMRFATPLGVLGVVAVLVAGPVLWPFVLRHVFGRRWYRNRFQLPYPTAWDYFFDKRRTVFVLVTLKSGNQVGGLWGSDSFASAHPFAGDLYLEAVYEVDEAGRFGDPIEGTRGLLLVKDEYSLIEFFDIPESKEDDSNE